MIRSWLARHKSLVATTISGVVIIALITTVALVSGGYSAQRVNLSDAAVWLTNQSKQVLGRANTQILQLNSVVPSTGHSIDVVQDAEHVLLVDLGNDTLAPVDTATAEAGKSVPLPPRSPTVQLAGDRLLISSSTGQLWLTTTAALSTFSAASGPTVDLGGRAITTMDADGNLFAFVPGTHMIHRIDTASSNGLSTSTRVPTHGTGSNDSLTTVGGHWALLDPTAKKLYLASGTVNLSSQLSGSSSPVLQEPSVSGDTVYIGTSNGLLAVPLGGGKATRVLSDNLGTPAAPVGVDGCVYAAWNDGASWKTCGTPQNGSQGSLSHMPSGALLSFKVNGPHVLLNDERTGAAWAVQDGNALINNWDDLISKKNDQEQVDQSKQDKQPQYEKAEVPPVAVNDSFGARPGRITPLPVLLNDYDANGNVLVIDSFTSVAATVGTLDLIDQNQELQVTLPATAAGQFSFEYTISDGQGGSATATVTVTVRTPTENSPPVCVRPTKALVQSGGTTTAQVLGDCYDPDGDPMFLANASVPPPDTVTFTPDGTVVYSDKGKGGTLKEVALTVSDGAAEGTGTLAVTVEPPGSVPIIADPFAVVGYQDQDITISPLQHVRGGTGPLRLSNVPAKPDATLTPDYEGGTFRFSSDQVGTHLLEYAVTDGVTTTTGTVRVDVQPPPEAKTQPIAVTHTAFIREQSTADVDVLATDIDPAGGVLLVTSVTQPPATTGVRVQTIDQSVLRVTLSRPLTEPVAFHYELSNGLAATQGTVTVVQLPPLTVKQPPVANPDNIAVRVGDIANIPVLANDEQPDGETLTLDPTLTTPLPAGDGLLFASGNELRYLAPSKPGNFTATYRVTASDGQWATAQVKISVRERDLATNNPPVPQTVTARVLAGDTVRIQIPLDGIDPDGDSVQLIGQESNPQKGAVVAVGSDWMDYQAGTYAAGTDTFTYGVIDSLGARATGTIRVGIADRIDGAENPVAVEDDVSVRPGKTLSVQVLANDSDPNGSPLTVTGIESVDGKATAVRDGNIVKVTGPLKEGVYSFIYTIQNARGGSSENFLRVTDSKNAPLSRPIVSDTDLGLSDILGKQSVLVNVLANVFFADGPVSSLKLSLLPGYGDKAVVTANKRVKVTITARSQIIPFEVAHPDDPKIVSYGFIRVPGFEDALPQLRRGAPTLTVKSEDTLVIHLNDLVVATAGKQVRLTDDSTVRATHSNGANLVVDDDTLAFTSAPRYFGTASIAFQVTDGTSATDPNGHVATIVVPIVVTPRTNQPPDFTGALIDFEPGQSKTINLVKLTSYPYAKDQNELAYTIQNPQPAGVTLSLNGQSLTIKVDENTPKGAQPSINIGVRDAVNAGQPGRIQLNVVPSTRPLAIAEPDVAIAPRGKTTVVDVLANDAATNPFPSVPLRVIAVQGLDSSNLPTGVSIAPSAGNGTLTVTVSATAAPIDTTLQYEVADATNDPDRYVWGSVVISVQDRPQPVTNLLLGQIADQSLTFSWSPGPFNNSPITGFQVTETRADTGQVVGTTQCQSTVCTIQTPGNGSQNAVNVAVSAKNALGLSDPVSFTSPVWSNVVPSAPTGLSSTPLNNGLRVSWTKPPDAPDASAITSYIVTVGGVSTSLSVSGSDSIGTSYSLNVTDPSIGNGVSTPYSVASVNDFFGGAVIWSQSNSSAIPSGPPLASASAPSATPDLTNGTSATLDWSGDFAPNGKAITSYFAAVYAGGSPPSCSVSGVSSGNPVLSVDPTNEDFQQVGGGTSNVTFNDLSPNTSYNFLVYAYNGQGCTPSAVATATPRARPGAPIDFSASVPGGNTGPGTFDVMLNSITPPANPGGATLSYQYEFTGAFSTSPAAVPADGDLSGGPQSYGLLATLQIRTIATYPGGVVVPASDWLTKNLQLAPVSAQLTGVAFAPSPSDPTTGQFTWTGWPTGSYDSVQFNCDGSNNFTDMPALGQTGVCTLPTGQLSGTLTVQVIANGGQVYQNTYASGDLP